MPRGRIEIFSDAVMAIIMTLLVLDLRAPELGANTPLHAYLQAMVPLGAEISELCAVIHDGCRLLERPLLFLPAY